MGIKSKLSFRRKRPPSSIGYHPNDYGYKENKDGWSEARRTKSAEERRALEVLLEIAQRKRSGWKFPNYYRDPETGKKHKITRVSDWEKMEIMANDAYNYPYFECIKNYDFVTEKIYDRMRTNIYLDGFTVFQIVAPSNAGKSWLALQLIHDHIKFVAKIKGKKAEWTQTASADKALKALEQILAGVDEEDMDTIKQTAGNIILVDEDPLMMGEGSRNRDKALTNILAETRILQISYIFCSPLLRDRVNVQYKLKIAGYVKELGLTLGWLFTDDGRYPLGWFRIKVNQDEWFIETVKDYTKEKIRNALRDAKRGGRKTIDIEDEKKSLARLVIIKLKEERYEKLPESTIIRTYLSDAMIDLALDQHLTDKRFVDDTIGWVKRYWGEISPEYEIIETNNTQTIFPSMLDNIIQKYMTSPDGVNQPEYKLLSMFKYYLENDLLSTTGLNDTEIKKQMNTHKNYYTDMTGDSKKNLNHLLNAWFNPDKPPWFGGLSFRLGAAFESVIIGLIQREIETKEFNLLDIDNLKEAECAHLDNQGREHPDIILFKRKIPKSEFESFMTINGWWNLPDIKDDILAIISCKSQQKDDYKILIGDSTIEIKVAKDVGVKAYLIFYYCRYIDSPILFKTKYLNPEHPQQVIFERTK